MSKKVFIPILIIIGIIVISGLIVGSSFYLKQQNSNNNVSIQLSPYVQPTKRPPPMQEDMISLKGQITCLPHKNTSGPQTLECAIGLQGDDSKYYGLENLNQEDLISGKFSGGTRVSITGELIKPANLEKYDVVGNIYISTIKEL